MFLWRILSEAIAAGTVLVRRGITRNAQCKRCCQYDESIEHLFFKCIHAQAIWRGTPNIPRDIYNPASSFHWKFQAIIDCYNNHNLTALERQLPLWTLWRIWKSRNLLVYQKKGSSWQHDITHAKNEAQEWVECWFKESSNHNETRRRSSRLQSSSWTKPQEGFLKCNYDCNFTQNGDTPSKAAWIFRDSRGFFVNAGQSEGEICSTVLEAELQALLISMQQAWIKGYRHVIFEGDNFTATQIVNGNMQNFKVHYWIREISFWKKKFTDATFQWTRRDNNKAADRLARQRIPNHLSSVSYFYVPFSIVSILHEDHSS